MLATGVSTHSYTTASANLRAEYHLDARNRTTDRRPSLLSRKDFHHIGFIWENEGISEGHHAASPPIGAGLGCVEKARTGGTADVGRSRNYEPYCWKIGPDPARVGRRQRPAHELRVCADEEIR